MKLETYKVGNSDPDSSFAMGYLSIKKTLLESMTSMLKDDFS